MTSHARVLKLYLFFLYIRQTYKLYTVLFIAARTNKAASVTLFISTYHLVPSDAAHFLKQTHIDTGTWGCLTI